MTINCNDKPSLMKTSPSQRLTLARIIIAALITVLPIFTYAQQQGPLQTNEKTTRNLSDVANTETTAKKTGIRRSEFGLGLSALYLPDYIGSNQSRPKILPFPHVRINNKYLEIDRGGARGLLFNSDLVDLSISFSGSLPLNSKDNDQRRGMSDLDVIAEVGPALRLKLINSNPTSSTKLYLEAPFRAAFSLSSKKVGHIGWRWGLNLAYKYNWRDWRLSHRIGIEFSDQQFHNYIYGVNTPFVTGTRPYYAGNSGFTTSSFSSGMSRRIGRWWYGGFVSYYSLAGSEVSDSPLVNSNNAVTVGIAIAHIFNSKDK